jgi:hypothetical protein
MKNGTLPDLRDDLTVSTVTVLPVLPKILGIDATKG